MSDKELKSTIAIEVDGSGVSTGVAAVKRDLSSLGTAAQDAGKAMAGVGGAAQEGLKGAGKEVEATQRTINAFVSQIKNSVTDIKAAGDAAEKYRLRAIDKGIPENIYAPYVAQLKAVQQEQLNLANAAVKTNGQVAMSAAAMTNAMRGVPAQFTDIIVSLQSGQAPLTVLMQQGGQLKDMFGGVGNAVKAMGTYVLGLVNPLSLTAVAVGVLGYAAYSAAENTKALQNALTLTGAQGVTSLSNLDNVAKGLIAVGVRSGTAKDALVEFINAGVRVDGNLQAITKAAIDLEKYGGAAVQETAKAFAELSKDPLSSLDKLTLATYQQVEALLKQGDRTGAVVAAQKAFTESTENTARALSAQQGPIDVATEAWKRYGAAVWDTVKGVTAAVTGGGSKTGNAVREDLQKKRDRYAAEGYDTTKEDAELARYKRLDEAQKQGIANLQKEGELKNLIAKFDEKDEATKKLRERNLLLADNNKLLAAGLITQKQFDDSLKAFDKAPKAKNNVLSDADKGLREYNDLIAKSVGLNANFSEEWDKLSAAYKAGKINIDGLTLAQAELLKEQKFSKDIVKSLTAETDAYAKAEAATTAAHVAAINTLDKRTKHLQEQLAKQLEHNAAIGLSADAVGELEQATHLLNAAELERKANLQDGVMRSLDVIDGLREQAKLEREIAEAKRAGGAKKAAKEAFDEWKKTADKINDSITDALMRGFESGKGFAENLRDTVVNMFKTMVLRPTVSAIVNPVAQGITSMMGFSGAANAADATSQFGGTLGALTLGGSTIAAIGSSVATGVSAGLAGTSIAEAATAYSAAGMSGVAGGLSAGSAIGSGLAAIGPVGWAALAALAVLSLQDHGKPSNNTGDSAGFFDASGKLTSRQSIALQTASADNFVDALQKSYLDSAKALGIGIAQTAFGFGSNTGKNGESPNSIVWSQIGGGAFDPAKNAFNSGEVSAAQTQLAASRAVFAALQGSDLPAYLSKMFDGLNAASMTQEQISNTLAYAQSIKQVRDALLETREPLQILKDNVSQGMAALATSADTFKQDFVKAIDAGITPGDLAQWQALQTAMNDLAAASGKANEAVRSTADILNERIRLQDRLDELTMTSAQLIEKQRSAIDASNVSLFDQVQAQEAVKAATDAATSAAEAMAQRVSGAMASLADTQISLQAQLLAAQGDASGALALTRKSALAKLTDGLAEADAASVTAAYEYNTALEDQIKALNDAKSAAEAAASAQASAASAAQRAAEQLRTAWQSVTDSIFAEVKRIRGLMGGGGAQSYAQAQAAFSITTAQARAGDQDAAKLLPALSQTLLTLAEANATTLAELRRIQGRTASSLDLTGRGIAGQYGLQLPSFDVGTNYVPHDMLAQVHKGEAIIPKAYNPVNAGGHSNADMAAELREVRSLLAQIMDSSKDTAKSTRTLEKTIVAVTEGGTGMLIAANSEIPVTVLM